MAKTDVVKKEDSLPADMLKGMMEDAKTHGQTFTPDQLIIPRLTILQDLSPQLKERKAEYVPGAKAGMIYNNITNTLDEEILFTPAKFEVAYIAWQENRGGLVDPNLTKQEVEENFKEVGLGMWTGLIKPRGKENAVAVEVIETPTWVGVAAGDGWGPMPVAIAFPVTKAKSARKINTAIDMTEVDTGKGMVKPPAFYHSFTLRTAIESSGENEWYGWLITHNGVGKHERMIQKARDLKIAFDEGDAVISAEGAER